MVFVLNDIGVLHDGKDLGDVAKAFTKNKLGCGNDTFIFWSLEILMCVRACVCDKCGWNFACFRSFGS
jgi:hypothetical protein